ncbi:MAG: class I SAM-dependent methyltransferase [Pseudanabaenaceae cyanobacterium bins.68]|nr:class I SAM-dependent methyltransferase [Pseudanabaenaceae cyanobacterium bins.68]
MSQDFYQANQRKIKSLTAARGELSLPCLPSLLKQHFASIRGLLQALGQQFTQAELDSLHQALATRLEQGFAASPYARLTFCYEPPNPMAGLTSGLRISFRLHTPTTAEKYQGWVNDRGEHLFGTHADAKVLAIAAQLPPQAAILDVGAGPGRNTIPLAKQGFQLDAIELAPVFVDQLRSLTENLPVEVILGDILQPETKVKIAHYDLAIVAEVISHFRDLDQVQLLLARMCDGLKSGGYLLFSTFVTQVDYNPEPLVRELAQTAWSFLITPTELQAAIAPLPLEIISQEPAFAYEQEHLPTAAFPPTPWFSSWATGRDLFPMEAEPPANLQWILARRS